MRIGFGCDHAGLELKQQLIHCASAEHETVDFGTHTTDSVDYPDIAHAASAELQAGRIDRAILICGTGVGMAMAAGRRPGVRAVVCTECFSAEMSRRHNDANVLCLGSRVIGPGLAERIANAWLSTPFEGGRHARRVEKIENISTQ